MQSWHPLLVISMYGVPENTHYSIQLGYSPTIQNKAGLIAALLIWSVFTFLYINQV